MAVAIKKMGFKNIKIYNGGLKDWMKSNQPIEVLEPIPEYEGRFINSDELLEKLREGEACDCEDKDS